MILSAVLALQFDAVKSDGSMTWRVGYRKGWPCFLFSADSG
jgi:hypothetical protein